MKTKSQPETVTRSSATITKGKLLGYTLVVALSLIWGLAFVAIRRATFELSPVNLTIIRWLIASAGFLLLAPIFGRPKKPVRRQDVPRILLVSVASVMGYHLSLNYAESIVSSGLAGLLISFGPIFAVLLSAVFLKERIETRLMLALASAVAGALVLSVNTDLDFGQITGPLAVILAAFMYGVFSVGSKPLVREYGALPTAIWVAVIGTVFTLPLISSSLTAQLSALSPVGWFSVIYLAVLSTVVANMMLFTLIRDRAVSRLSVQLYLVPLASLVGGVLLLGESVSILTVFGALLLFVGIALATHRQ